LSFSFFFSLFTRSIHAQQVNENRIPILNKKQRGSFPLVTEGIASSIHFDATDAQVVQIAAKALQEDIKMVTGTTPVLDSSNSLQP